MKISADNVAQQEGIETRVAGTAGLKYGTIADLKGVEQLDKLDSGHSLLLVKSDSGLGLQSVALP